MPGRVVVNGRFLSRRVTGVERYAREISSRFRPETRLVTLNLPVRGLLGHLWEQCVLPRYIRQDDILWSPANTGPLSVENQVLSLHDPSVFDHPEWFKSSYVMWYRILLPRLVTTVRKIITMSEFSKTRIEKIFKIPSGQVSIISEGVDTRHFYPRDAPENTVIRQRYGLEGDYLLTVATIEPRKNIDRLLAAWELAAPGLVNTTLVIVGGRYPVFREVSIPDTKRDVRWLGYVDEQDLPSLYTCAKAFILPSLYEGFGLSALEAMACRTAVIVSKAGALPEVMGDSAIYIDPGSTDSIAQAIEYTLCDHRMREELSQKCFERAQTFSWDKAAQGVWQILLEANT